MTIPFIFPGTNIFVTSSDGSHLCFLQDSFSSLKGGRGEVHLTHIGAGRIKQNIKYESTVKIYAWKERNSLLF